LLRETGCLFPLRGGRRRGGGDGLDALLLLVALGNAVLRLRELLRIFLAASVALALLSSACALAASSIGSRGSFA
jgi:hypothetical protein